MRVEFTQLKQKLSTEHELMLTRSLLWPLEIFFIETHIQQYS